ncbi:HNH endonuclease [Streptomyces afghaniensis]|uniref:HNH endonuclease n=1 Tax=Streptomyces afghaniensis TaxID=66865 RepID=UPI0037BD76BB
MSGTSSLHSYENLITMGTGYGTEDTVQWILQPRGGPAKRGPRNFEHSVRKGIRLAEYEHVLGRYAELLNRIFPDGVARLWGATPAAVPWHTKAAAIRNQKVGDEVLFYAEGRFIAKARILGLMHSPELAAAVWGADEGQKTWEHIVALGDVVEIDIPAAPLLTTLVNRPDLRSLTCIPADVRQQHLALLNSLLDGLTPQAEHQPSEEKPTASVPRMRREELLHALGTLNADTSDEQHTRDASLTFLWALGRLVSGQRGMASRDLCAREVGPLLLDFGAQDVHFTLEYAFRHLQDSGLWQAEGTGDGATVGLQQDVMELLQKPLARAEAVGLLCSSSFQDVDQEALLERVGLAGYANAEGAVDGANAEPASGGEASSAGRGRRQVNGSRPDRDPHLAEQIKLIYGHRCQVCGERLETRFSHYSEAAHIQGVGRPHEGPDKLSNMLCLCPNHHVQFDKLFFFIDEDWNVRRSRDEKLIGALIRHPQHGIDEECVEYHRGLCGRSRY